MPIYTIKCTKCEQLTDELIKRSQVKDDKTVNEFICSECGSESGEIQFPSSTSFSLKGSCWSYDGYK